MSLKPMKKNIGTNEKPYGVNGSEMWFLPRDPKANGTKAGDIIAETDSGYLVVFNKDMIAQPEYYPKAKVQN